MSHLHDSHIKRFGKLTSRRFGMLTSRLFDRLTSRRFDKLTSRPFSNIAPATPLPDGRGFGAGLSPLPDGRGLGVGLSPLPDGRGWGWVFVAVFVLSSCTGSRYDALLRQADSLNRSGFVFTSDSLAMRIVKHYDHFWHSANDRLLAYYLLGRAHADMGDAPLAIENYQTAISKADTTSADCDFRTLRAVYGQMAEVFHAQNLPEDELEAQDKCNYYSWILKDTLNAISGYACLMRPYYLLSDTDHIIQVTQEAEKKFLQFGYEQEAARVNVALVYFLIQRKQFEEAKELIDTIRKRGGIFDERGNLNSGRESFYATIGDYYNGVNQLDSAEHYYRKAILPDVYEAAYRGLLSVYDKKHLPDSVSKYARLYADANDAMHRKMNSSAVHSTQMLYKYNLHLQEAERQERHAREMSFLLMIAIALLLVLFVAYHRIKEDRRRKEKTLAFISEQYRQTRETLESIVEEKQQIEREQELLLAKKDFYSHTVTQSVIDHSIFRRRPLKAKEINRLHDIFIKAFPHFKDFVGNQSSSFSENEWDVCALLSLGLHNSDIAFLLNLTPQRVTGLMSQINHVLFNSEGASSLAANLRKKLIKE